MAAPLYMQNGSGHVPTAAISMSISDGIQTVPTVGLSAELPQHRWRLYPSASLHPAYHNRRIYGERFINSLIKNCKSSPKLIDLAQCLVTNKHRFRANIPGHPGNKCR